MTIRNPDQANKFDEKNQCLIFRCLRKNKKKTINSRVYAESFTLERESRGTLNENARSDIGIGGDGGGGARFYVRKK